MATITAHRANVTGLIPCIHAIGCETPPPSLLRPKFSAPDKTLLDPGRQTRWEAGRERRQLPQLPGAAQTPPSTTGMRWPSSLTSLFLVEAPRGSTETRSAQCTGPRPDSLKQSTVGRLARGPGTSNDVQLTFFPAAPAPPALSQPYLPRYRALGLELYGFVGNVGGQGSLAAAMKRAPAFYQASGLGRVLTSVGDGGWVAAVKSP